MDEKERKDIEDRVCRDYAKDVRLYMHNLKWIVAALCIVLVLLIAGLVVLEVNHQNRMMEVANHATDKMVELFGSYDWETEYEIESTGNEMFSGNIHVEK